MSPALSRGWLGGSWARLTAAGALTATVLDAALLQRRRAFFTGGFLSVDHITHAGQAVGFLVGSLLADAAVIGVLVVAGLWVAGRLRWPRAVALSGALALALAPVVVADFVTYRIAAFLGDAFDLGLLFELAGRDPAEVFAVSSTHVWPLAAALVAAAAAIVGLGVVVFRALRRRTPSLLPRWPARQLLVPALWLLLVGISVTAGLRAASEVLDNGLRRKPTANALGVVFDLVSDVDRDGFGPLSRPADPDAFDARIAPWAIDVPGNGVDEDGIGGDLPSAAPPYVEPGLPAARWAQRPDVVLIVLESFRADVIGERVGAQAVTPVLNALAAAGVASAHAYSHNGYTVQSRRHIFSGSLADLRQGTLIDDFKANGYEVGYFSAQDESFGGPAYGVGFDRADVAYDARQDADKRYSTFSTPGSLAVPHAVLAGNVEHFLAARRGGRPLFLYLNFHDTHFPYHHAGLSQILPTPVLPQAEIVPHRAEDLRRMYLNTAANVDGAIGRVLTAAREALGKDPAVIVLADHGESLFDGGFLGHGYALNEAQTRIPLIVSNLGLAIREPFGQVDLRGAIAEAMTASRQGRPELVPDRSRMVFQYLGTLRRPAQIALASLDGQIVYDFRTRRVKLDAGGWQAPETLATGDMPRLLDLIHLWERMMIARLRHRGADD